MNRLNNGLSALARWSCSLLLLAITAAAQSNVGMIRGKVTDRAGAAVRGATVRLINPMTNYTQTAVTDSQGAYQLIDAPFNRYSLTVEASGFGLARQEVVVTSNLVRQIDLQLEVASVRQEVSVAATGDLIDAEKTTPSVSIDRNRILNVPTTQPSRSAEEIIATTPGWTLDANGRLHARGIEYQAQYSIDGIPVTDTMASTFAASPDPRNFRTVELTTV